jgi:hypothetical protein
VQRVCDRIKLVIGSSSKNHVDCFDNAHDACVFVTDVVFLCEWADG